MLGGCESYPGLDSRWDDDVVATGLAPDADFGDYRSFAVNPTIHIVKELDDGGVSQEPLADKHAEPIVEAVVENMTARDSPKSTRTTIPTSASH